MTDAPSPWWGDDPDLSDPSTTGRLLACVREAWGRQMCVLYSEDHDHWWVVYPEVNGRMAHDSRLRVHGSEASALLAALKASPKERGDGPGIADEQPINPGE